MTIGEFMLRDLDGDRLDVFVDGIDHPGQFVYVVTSANEFALSADQALELALALLKAREALS